MVTQALTTRPLDALARDINYAHGSILEATSSMLKWARRAGEFLIEAKKQCPHGTFKDWVEANTRVKYDTAKEYMQVAKRSKTVDLHLFDGGIRAFLDATRERPTTKPSAASNLPAFTQDDAEYALKIAARIDSDFEGESALTAIR
ncbi:hypothetical protein [Oleispirillum naphthae]|uniref:hypothetical protein n=1 Tax=Oleispirillum naphthae TaxID=2838853 RepID=UPI003082506D